MYQVYPRVANQQVPWSPVLRQGSVPFFDETFYVGRPHHGDGRGSDVFSKDGLQTSDGVLKMGSLTSRLQETNGSRRTDGLKTYGPASLSPS